MNAKLLKSFLVYLILIAVLAWFGTKIERETVYTTTDLAISASFLELVGQLEEISLDTEFVSGLNISAFRTSLPVLRAPTVSETGRFNPFRFSGGGFVPTPEPSVSEEEFSEPEESVVEEVIPENEDAESEGTEILEGGVLER